MALRLILKKDGKWQDIPMPDQTKLTAAAIATWQGKPCRIQYVDQDNRTFYVYGTDDVKWKPEEHKLMMDIPSFCLFWQYEMLRYGIDMFAKIENRAERVAIMTEDASISEQQANEYCDTKPYLYSETQQDLL